MTAIGFHQIKDFKQISRQRSGADNVIMVYGNESTLCALADHGSFRRRTATLHKGVSCGTLCVLIPHLLEREIVM